MSYKILDSGRFYKLELVGEYRLVRPSPQAVWRPSLGKEEWDIWDAKFIRDKGGRAGKWTVRNPGLNADWFMEQNGLKFLLKLTDFGHLGIFPEHLGKLEGLQHKIEASPFRSPKILNLFAYTGAATFACVRAGAEVVHVDSSKTSVAWARKNAAVNGLTGKPIRWLVEDVRKFVERELRRGSFYHGIILDPPSYGLGGNGKVWKIEKDLCDLLDSLWKLLAKDFLFLLLTSHSHGYSPAVLKNLLAPYKMGGQLASGEMLIPEASGRSMPSGAFALMGGS